MMTAEDYWKLYNEAQQLKDSLILEKSEQKKVEYIPHLKN
jgi:hypothetical protein